MGWVGLGQFVKVTHESESYLGSGVAGYEGQ